MWTDWRRLADGLLRPGAAEAMRRERDLVARIRGRCTAPRVVSVLAGKGGVGTTTAAAAIGLVLAALRHDATALVDPRHATASLGRRLAGQPAPTVDGLAVRERGRPATVPLRVAGALDVVDGAPWHRPVRGDVLTATLDELRDAHAFTIVDVGTHPTDNTRLVLGRTHRAVVVTTPTAQAEEAVRVALLRIRAVVPDLLGTVVLAVAGLTPRPDTRAPDRLAATLGLPPARIVAVPYDPALRGGGALDPARLRPATRIAFLRLAGLVVDPGEPTPDPLALSEVAAS